MCATPRRSVTSGQRYAGGSTTWNSWPPTTRRSIGVSSSRVARDTGCVRREHRSLVPSSLLAHNGEFTRRRCQTSADSFVFCSITTTPGRTRKRARASYSPPRPQATREDGHPRRDGRRLWRLCTSSCAIFRFMAEGVIGLGGGPQFFLLFFQKLHIQVAMNPRGQPSWVSAQRARTKRRQLAALGKILTTRVRRLISSLRRSSMFVLFRCVWC